MKLKPLNIEWEIVWKTIFWGMKIKKIWKREIFDVTKLCDDRMTFSVKHAKISTIIYGDFHIIIVIFVLHFVLHCTE